MLTEDRATPVMGPVVSSDLITSRNGPRNVLTSISLKSVNNYINITKVMYSVFQQCPTLPWSLYRQKHIVYKKCCPKVHNVYKLTAPSEKYWSTFMDDVLHVWGNFKILGLTFCKTQNTYFRYQKRTWY